MSFECKGDNKMEEYIIRQEEFLAAQDRRRPCVLFRPSLYIDGDQWCALYGENLQDGVAGFGDSPALAMADFDMQWEKKLTPGRSLFDF